MRSELVKTAEERNAYRRKLYADRKHSGKCIDCAATLQEDDGLRCVDCAERNAIYRARFRRTSKFKRRDNARRRAIHARRADAGQCVFCGVPALEGHTMCAGHLQRNRRYQREWQYARRHGLLQLRTVLDRPRLPTKRAPAEKQTSIVDRVFAAMQRLDWVNLGEVCDALEIGEGDALARDAVMQALSRYTRLGVLERRRLTKLNSDYRLRANRKAA